MGWFNFTTGVHAKVPDYGLSFEGIVTTATDTTHFKVDTLKGKGTGFFIPASGDPYEIYVVQADAGAPEGEHKPVVAYTSSDGTFQHAVFSAQLAVGDIVLIIHPWLARLLDLYTDWENGGRLDLLLDAIIGDLTSAVTQPPTAKSLHDILHKDGSYTYDNTTDALEAIRDRIDTINTADQIDLDAILDDTNSTLPAQITALVTDYLAHATYGLDAIKTLLNTFPAILDTLDTRTASIVTDYLAHGTYGLDAIKSLLNTHSGVLSTLDSRTATIVTDYLAHASYGLDAIKSALNTANNIIPDLRSNLCRWGQITAVSGNTFTSVDFAGLGADAMHGWTVYVMQADDAAPEGEYRGMTDYTNAGVVSHNAFSTALAIGDRVQLIHPLLMAAHNMRGGVEGLQDIIDNQNAELDTARGKYTKTMTGGEDDLYGESSDTEFCLQEFRADLHNMDTDDVIVFRIYTTEDGTARKISVDAALTFSDAQDPARVEIIGSANQVWGREDISVTAEQTGTGTLREITCYWRDAKRGS